MCVSGGRERGVRQSPSPEAGGGVGGSVGSVCGAEFLPASVRSRVERPQPGPQETLLHEGV